MSKLKSKKKRSKDRDLDQKSAESYNMVQETIKLLERKGFKVLSRILTTMAEKNPYKANTPQYIMWNEQAGINIPLLYLASLILHEHAQQMGAKHLLFVTRDCVHWVRIWNALFKDSGYNVTFFDSSRIMFQEAETKYNKYYMEYIDSVTEGDITKAVYIDAHGTASHLARFSAKRLQGKMPSCFFLTIGARTYKELPQEIQPVVRKGRFKACILDSRGSVIEMISYADSMGSLVNYDRNGPVRMPLEYDGSSLKPYYKCVNYFLKIHDKTPSYGINPQHADYCIQHIGKRIKKRENQPIINRWITHVRKHEDDAKKYKQERADNKSNTRAKNKAKKKSPKVQIRKKS